MKIAFLDCHTLNADGISLDPLQGLGEVYLYPRTKNDDIVERCKGVDIVISNKVKLTSDILLQLPTLKAIMVAATGYNNVDIPTAIRKGITVCNVQGYSTESVVQHTFSMILALTNKVGYYANQVNQGKWQSSRDWTFYDHGIPELSGKTLGILGYGNIGQRVAMVGAMMGMKTMAYVRNPDKIFYDPIELVSLDELFERADYLSLHAPLNEASANIINTSNLTKMKRSSFIINTARGGLVNENDLSEALIHNIIAGAALDTLSEEPPKENPLIGLENCIITPHIAWASIESRKRLLNGIVENIKAFLKGKPQNVII